MRSFYLEFKERTTYQQARSELNRAIRETSSTIHKNLDILVKERSFTHYELLKKWEQSTSAYISDFSQYTNLDDIPKKLGVAFKKYWHFVFLYRSFFKLHDNIIFFKILTFEYYFLSNEGILNIGDSTKPIKLSQEMTLEEKLFYKSPLAHYMLFRVFCELGDVRKALSDQQKRNTYLQLLEAGEEFFIDFVDSIDKFGVLMQDHQDLLSKHSQFSTVINHINSKFETI